MRERRQRADHRHLADVALAEIGFQSPDRDDDLGRHAELLLDTPEQRAVTLQHLPAHVDAAGADAGRDILLKSLAKRAALAAVKGQHRGILGDAGEGLVDHRLRDAGGLRFRAMLCTKALKSPPQRAAAAGVAARSEVNKMAEKNLCMRIPVILADHAMGKLRAADAVKPHPPR